MGAHRPRDRRAHGAPKQLAWEVAHSQIKSEQPGFATSLGAGGNARRLQTAVADESAGPTLCECQGKAHH